MLEQQFLPGDQDLVALKYFLDIFKKNDLGSPLLRSCFISEGVQKSTSVCSSVVDVCAGSYDWVLEEIGSCPSSLSCRPAKIVSGFDSVLRTFFLLFLASFLLAGE